MRGWIAMFLLMGFTQYSNIPLFQHSNHMVSDEKYLAIQKGTLKPAD